MRGALRRSTVPGAPADTAGVARLTQQVEIVREAYGSVLLVVQGFFVSAGSAVLGLLSLEPIVLVLVLPPLLLGLALFVGALGRMASRQRDSILADERIAEGTSALAHSLRDVVACGAEETVAARVGEHIDAQARATKALARLTAVRTLAVAVGGWLPLILILLVGPWLVRRGATTGTILGALTYVLQGVHPALQSLVRQLGDGGLWLLVALRRVVETTDIGAEAVEPRAGRGHLDGARPASLELRLRHVTFRYGRRAEPVVGDLDLDVPEGDHLAVVGPSGVGKSTLAGLITGVLRPQEGEITIGGVAVRQLDAHSLASQRVLIPQEAYVFAGSLWENLTYLRPRATRAQVDAAVERLEVRPLIDRLGGYEAEVDRPSLSAGERQVLTLVRAYLSPAKLVVLDEATCHLDPAAEAQAERAFARRSGTLIVIAHRISSARRARRILVMDGTRVLLGTHAELLTQSALYRDLVGLWGSDVRPVKPRGRRRAPRQPAPVDARQGFTS